MDSKVEANMQIHRETTNNELKDSSRQIHKTIETNIKVYMFTKL